MDRRTFIGRLAFGLIAAAFASLAQQAGKVYRIGMLETTPAAMNAPTPAGAPRRSTHATGY
jgi:hypothetical protein